MENLASRWTIFITPGATPKPSSDSLIPWRLPFQSDSKTDSAAWATITCRGGWGGSRFGMLASRSPVALMRCIRRPRYSSEQVNETWTPIHPDRRLPILRPPHAVAKAEHGSRPWSELVGQSFGRSRSPLHSDCCFDFRCRLARSKAA